MKMFDKRVLPAPPAPYTVADMKAEQVFKIGKYTYIRTQRDVIIPGCYEAFRVNNAGVYDLQGSTVVTPIKAEFHRV